MLVLKDTHLADISRADFLVDYTADGRGTPLLATFSNLPVPAAGGLITGTTGADVMHYGLGADTLQGGSGNDTINVYETGQAIGGAGDDLIYGGGSTTSWGAMGADSLIGFDNAIVRGGDGNDVILLSDQATGAGGSGDDDITLFGFSDGYGGAGNDTFHIDGTGMAYGQDGDDHFDLGHAETIGQVAGGATVVLGAGADTVTVHYPTGSEGELPGSYDPGVLVDPYRVSGFVSGQHQIDLIAAPGNISFAAVNGHVTISLLGQPWLVLLDTALSNISVTDFTVRGNPLLASQAPNIGPQPAPLVA